MTSITANSPPVSGEFKLTQQSERLAIDKNYVGYLPIIDRIFGTYHFPPNH